MLALYLLAIASLSFCLPSLDVLVKPGEILIVSKEADNNVCNEDVRRVAVTLNLEEDECMNLPAGKYKLCQSKDSFPLLFNFSEPVVICKQGKFYNIFYAKNYILFMSLTVH